MFGSGVEYSKLRVNYFNGGSRQRCLLLTLDYSLLGELRTPPLAEDDRGSTHCITYTRNISITAQHYMYCSLISSYCTLAETCLEVAVQLASLLADLRQMPV